MNNKLELLKLTMTYCPATRLYWTDTISGLFVHQQALDYAQSLNMRLPTKEEFELAFNNGLKFDNSYFWSSSVHSQGPDYAFFFSSKNGIFVNDHLSNVYRVRCVVENI